jgi:hypothetical protein
MVLNLFYATQTLSVQENLKPKISEYSSEIIKIIIKKRQNHHHLNDTGLVQHQAKGSRLILQQDSNHIFM